MANKSMILDVPVGMRWMPIAYAMGYTYHGYEKFMSDIHPHVGKYMGGSCIVYKREDLDKWMESHKI